MRMTRRTLLIGAGAGALSVLLASCTPEPTPTPTKAPTPKPTPTGSAITPSATLRSGWAKDPFTRGAASFTPVGVQNSARDALAVSVNDRVFFAGEATDSESPGTVRAALRSGARVAEDVARAAGPDERIAVIGAGVAGATTASALVSAGLDVTVFEASDRIGGRLRSHTGDEWPVPVQLGAWLAGPADAEFLAQLNTIDVRTIELGTADWVNGDASTENAGAVLDPISLDALQSAIDAAAAQPADASIVDALSANGADPAASDVAAALAYVSAMSGMLPADASTWFPPALPAEPYSGALGDLEPLFATLLGGIRVSLSSPVSRVAYDDTGVSLRLGTGESLSFDRVVVTASLGVLQSNGIEFAPALPFTHRGAITELAMGDIETIWLRFDEPFWTTESDIWHVVGGDSLVRTWFNLLPSTGENVLVGVVGGADATAFAELDDAAATASALATLQLLADAEPAV